MRVALFSLLLGASALAGCARGVTIDEAFGRPGATEWTYFEQPARDVVDSIAGYYSLRDIVVESVREENGGVVLTLAYQTASADVSQVFVQSVSEGAYQSRAQNYLNRRPLPRDLEAAITGGY